MRATPGSRTLAQAGVVSHNMTVEILEEPVKYRWMRRAQLSAPPQRRPAHHRVRSNRPTVEADHLSNDQLDRQIDELEHILRRHDLAQASRISQLE